MKSVVSLLCAAMGVAGCASSGTSGPPPASVPEVQTAPAPATPVPGGTASEGTSVVTPAPVPAAQVPAPAAPATPVSTQAPTVVVSPPQEPTVVTSQCKRRDVSTAWAGVPGARPAFAFPTILDARPGATVVSGCIKIVTGGTVRSLAISAGELSIDGAAFRSGTLEVSGEADVRIRLRAASGRDESVTTTVSVGGEPLGSFEVRTVNSDRAATAYRVGPGRPYATLGAVAELLQAGDLVEVDGDATYPPVEFSHSGSAQKPITVRGIAINGKRPRIAGGTTTVSFAESHYVIFENFEVSGGSQICLRAMANELTVRNVYIHDCARHGILGADLYSGSLTVDRVEITRAGGQPAGENTKHPLYVATDRDRFPGSRLRVQSSYIHDFGGGGVKSRSERNEIYFNWIDARDDAATLYSLELYGYEEYATLEALNSDVVGNVLIHRGARGLRLGGDGTGASKGRVRFVRNTVVLSSRFANASSPVFRLFQALESVDLINNAFVIVGQEQSPVLLFRDDIAPDAWTSGGPRIAGLNNWVPSGSTILPNVTVPLVGTLSGSTNPGLASLGTFAALDVAPIAGSALIDSGSPLGSTMGYEIPAPLLELRVRSPGIAPTTGTALESLVRPTSASQGIGAL